MLKKMSIIYIFIMMIIFVTPLNVFAGDAVINWTASDASEQVEGYVIYWNKTSTPDVMYNQIVHEPTITLSELLFEVNESYTFVVTAYNSVGESIQSDEVYAIVRPEYLPPDNNLPTEIIIDKPSKITITVNVE